MFEMVSITKLNPDLCSLMQVTIIAATEKEIELLKQSLDPMYFTSESNLRVCFHITGVGMLASCFSISQLIFTQRPDLIIQAGIAGTFDHMLPLGTVVTVENEYTGDLGVVENGIFNDLFDLHLLDKNSFPFTDAKLVNGSLEQLNITGLQVTDAITVNEISTDIDRISLLRKKYEPTIESMEGASLHYCCIKTGTSFIQIRAISNYAGERDKRKWAFSEAFKNLSQTVMVYIEQLKILQENLQTWN